jgi:hypothetical protein
MKTLSNADAKQLERIYLHLRKNLDISNDKTNNCVRHLKLIIKKLNV